MIAATIRLVLYFIALAFMGWLVVWLSRFLIGGKVKVGVAKVEKKVEDDERQADEVIRKMRKK